MTPTPDTSVPEALRPLIPDQLQRDQLQPAPETVAAQTVVPEETPPARLPRPARTRKLSKRQMGSLAEDLMREHSREVLTDWWSIIKHKLRLGDAKTMEMVGRMYQYDKGPGGVTIFNQHLQVNNTQGESAPRVRSFDQIIGKLEEAENIARQNRLLNAPVSPDLENSDEDAEDIEDIQDGDPDIEDNDAENTDGDPENDSAEIEDNQDEPVASD